MIGYETLWSKSSFGVRVVEIKRLLNEGLSHQGIAEHFGCCPKTISDFIRDNIDKKKKRKGAKREYPFKTQIINGITMPAIGGVFDA